MLQDWRLCVEQIRKTGAQAQTVQPVLYTVWQQLNGYLADHAGIFRAKEAASGFGSGTARYHSLLRNQLAQPLRPFCADDFAAQFAAEAMLTWTVEGKSFEDLYSVLKKLF